MMIEIWFLLFKLTIFVCCSLHGKRVFDLLQTSRILVNLVIFIIFYLGSLFLYDKKKCSA